MAETGFNWQGTVDAAVAQVANIFQREFDPTIAPIQTTYQPGIGVTTTRFPTMLPTQPFALFNPSTWSLMHWALVGGGVFLAMRLMRPRRNPCMTNPRRRRARRNPFPSSALSFHSNPHPPGGSAAMVVHRFGPNPTRRPKGSRVRFHGAFALKTKADAKAKRLGGWVKPFRVRGQQRYSVVTAA